MKNDTTTTFMTFVLAALAILGVVFALLTIYRMHDLRTAQVNLNRQLKVVQTAQALLNETAAYNATAKSPELAQLIAATQPQQVARPAGAR